MRDKFPIGFNKYGELVIAEFDIRKSYGHNGFGDWEQLDGIQFSASFNTVRPFIFNEDRLEEVIADKIDEYDYMSKWNLCEQHDLKPSELAGFIARHDGIEGGYDISLYSESFRIGGEEIYFESGSCGQHDIRKDSEFTAEDGGDESNIMMFVSQEFLNYFLNLWDEYHLKPITQEIKAELYQRLDKEYARHLDTQRAMGIEHIVSNLADDDRVIKEIESEWIRLHLTDLFDNGKLDN